MRPPGGRAGACAGRLRLGRQLVCSGASGAKRGTMRAGAILTIGLSSLPGAVLAQNGAQVAPATVRACFDAARPADRGAPACAGEAARACQALPGGQTTLGITECLMAEAAVWGDLMRAALTRQAAALATAGPDQAPDLARQLDAAQTAWAAYRDAQCGLVYAIWLDGSIRTIMAGACHLRMLAARAVELRFLGEME